MWLHDPCAADPNSALSICDCVVYVLHLWWWLWGRPVCVEKWGLERQGFLKGGVE